MSSLLLTLRSLRRSAREHDLARRNVGAVFARFARLQVECRLRGRSFTFPLAGGTRLVGRPGSAGANGNYYLGLLELRDMAFAAHYLRPGDLFVDVGANVGVYSVLAAGAAGARGVAFEPSSDSLAQLRENLALNGIEDRVDVRAKAVAAACGTTRFSVGKDTLNHIVGAGEDVPSVEVPVSTLDRELAAPPRLLKIDAEGYDGEVLLGAEEALRGEEPMAILVELSRRPGEIPIERCFDLLASLGFEGFAYRPLTRSLVALARGDNGGMSNWLFVRGAAFAAERVRSAPRLTVGTLGEI